MSFVLVQVAAQLPFSAGCSVGTTFLSDSIHHDSCSCGKYHSLYLDMC